jgi:hypothetical protein
LHNNPPCVESADYTYQNGWQGKNAFEIKAERMPERCILFPVTGGANYIFSSRQGTSENWQQIMTVHRDDPVEIPNESIEILNEKIAYIFMANKYAVTTDRGKTWKIWDAQKDLIDWKRTRDKYPNWASIERIYLRQDGSGEMKLDRFYSKENLIKDLHTKDFGKNWNP